jgi:AcrR family transcriptional regulator
MNRSGNVPGATTGLVSHCVTTPQRTQEPEVAPGADPRPPRARGSYSKGRAKRAEILREAVQVFAESGFRGGSLKDIADRVGLSQAGLLHHFSSKEQLLAEVISERDAEDTARLWGSDETPPTGWLVLERMAELVRHNTTVPGLVQLFATLSGEAVAHDHPAHAHFVDRYRRVREQFTDALTRARADGVLAADIDPATEAYALVALMDGLQVQWLLEPDAVDMAAVFEAALARLRP